MKTYIAGDILQIRIKTYRSYRHYGGRVIQVIPHVCQAKYMRQQQGAQPHIVELMETTGEYPAGHVIAVMDSDIVV